MSNDVKKILADQIRTEAKYKLALEKIATLKKQNDVMETVISLVSEGIIDALEAKDSVDKFYQDPSKFATIKQAHMEGIPLDVIGEFADLSPSKDDMSANEEFENSLK